VARARENDSALWAADFIFEIRYSIIETFEAPFISPKLQGINGLHLPCGAGPLLAPAAAKLHREIT
jgi:hypothetical protein